MDIDVFSLLVAYLSGGNQTDMKTKVLAIGPIGAILLFLLSHSAICQSISFPGTAFDLTKGASLQEPFFIPVGGSVQTTGIAFNPDGTKMFALDAFDNEVYQYSVSTPFDITSLLTLDGSPLDVGGVVTLMQSITFNNDGTKLYLASVDDNRIHQYDLTTPYDITSGVSYDGLSSSLQGQLIQPADVAFNEDGTKMYVIGLVLEEVFQYSLNTAFDVTAGHTYDGASLPVPATIGESREIHFSTDGSRLFSLGTSDGELSQYDLATPFDLAGGATKSTGVIRLQDPDFGNGLTFSADGNRVFMVNTIANEVQQFSLNFADFEEVDANDGAVDGEFTIILTGDTFTDAGATLDPSKYSIPNLPSGLSPVLMIATDGQSGTLTLSGNANPSNDAASVTNLMITFSDAAFTSSTAAGVTNAIAANMGVGVDFFDVSLSYFGAPFDIEDGITPVGTYSVQTEETMPTDVVFSNDGLTMFVTGYDQLDVRQYELEAPFDISSGVTALDLTLELDINTLMRPTGLAFNNDGTKLFVLDNFLRRIRQFTLSEPFNITSSVTENTSFSVSSTVISPYDLAFSNDGSLVYVMDVVNDDIHQYSLNVPFDFSGGGSSEGELPIGAQEPLPDAFHFSADGTKLFVVGAAQDIHEYDLSTPFQIIAGVSYDNVFQSIATEETDPWGITFSPAGDRFFTIGQEDDEINQYDLADLDFMETIADDGEVEGSLGIAIFNSTFTNAGGTLSSPTDYTINNLPSG